jgi:NAD(P)-dependent dehydrogenase (short-subunit alcohol dehydrogenase family)
VSRAPQQSYDGTELAGAVAVVTGAGQGLGRAEALALAAAGARVVVNDVGEAAEAVVAEITAAGGEAVAHPGDIGDWDFATGLVRRAIETYGELNVLVNNAGVLRDRMIFSVSADEWDTVLRVHLRGHAATCQAATAYWREKSKQAGGPVAHASVVNTTSEAFLFGSAGQPNYAAAKAGIVALTLAVAQGCGRYGVRANAIAPRARTAMTEAMFPEPPANQPDPLASEHVSPVVVWLGSAAASHVTGQVFVVYAGKVGVLAAPTVDASFSTSSDETWTVDELGKTVGAFLADGEHGFAVGTGLRL